SVPVLGLLYGMLLLLGFPVAGLPAAIRTLAYPSILELLVVISVAWLGATFFLLPVVGGRLLMRGLRPVWYPLWDATYLLCWFYGKIVAISPLRMLAGSPLLPPYLRLLGAKVGRDCHFTSARIGL